jgi:undecaprenyl diphosphate synthase
MHVAIIMDGNGRWATARGLTREQGHRAGAENLRPIVESAGSLGITTLSLYAFSSDNWKRPTSEVTALMALMSSTLREQFRRCVRDGVRVSAIGRRDRLPRGLRELLNIAERETAGGSKMHLRLAIDYSSRDALVEAARRGVSTRDEISLRLGAPDVDLLIRTGGERRLSDFLLWECAYAELLFSPVAWPDFSAHHLSMAVDDFRCRDRRYGGLTPAA